MPCWMNQDAAMFGGFVREKGGPLVLQPRMESVEVHHELSTGYVRR